MPLHFMVERIEILDDIETYMQTEYGDIYPTNNVYTFKSSNTEFIKHPYNNMVDFKNLQEHHSQSKMNQRINGCIPNTQHLNKQTLNFSRINLSNLIVKNNLDKVKFKVKYYNIKIKIEYKNGSSQEALVFCS